MKGLWRRLRGALGFGALGAAAFHLIGWGVVAFEAMSAGTLPSLTLIARMSVFTISVGGFVGLTTAGAIVLGASRTKNITKGRAFLEPPETDIPQEVVDTGRHSAFLSSYRSSPQAGCRSATRRSGVKTIEFRNPGPESGFLCTTLLRVGLVDAFSVIQFEQWDHGIPCASCG